MQPGQSAQQSASTASSGGGLYIVGAVVIVLVFALQRVPAGVLVRSLSGRPQALLGVALGMTAFIIAFAARDIVRAQKRAYRPPSWRVQFTRSAAYGVALTLVHALAVSAWRPAFLAALASAGPKAYWATTLVVPYGLAAWLLCLRPRQFVAPVLPTFREAAHALRDTNDFLLGRTGDDWKKGEGDPAWFLIPERAMFANLYCLGGIGSGKTSAVAKPILEQALFKWPGDPRRKIGIFLLDAKGNNAEHVVARAAALGREEDVVILKPGGAWSYNPLAEGNPTALANKLVAALEAMTNQESNSYYKKMQREFAENAFQILADVLGPGRFTMMDVYDFICDAKVQQKYLDQAKPKNSISYRWFANQWAKEDPREQMMLTKGFRADLSSFVRDEIAPTFAVADANFPGWSRVINDGLVVVFSMSLDEYGDFARAMGIFCLMDFQQTMLARTTSRFRLEGNNTDRLVICFIDEVWAYMNPKLAEFTSVSREAKCCTLALHQGLAQIPEVYRNVVLGNFRTPIIMSVNDLLTLETFTRLFGTHKVLRESRSESSGYSGVEKQLLSDHLNARVGGESRSLSVSQTEVDEPRFSTGELLHLGKSCAVVQMFDGDTTRQPAVVHLLPDYLPENRLGGR